jgi:hypothetical protein
MRLSQARCTQTCAMASNSRRLPGTCPASHWDYSFSASVYRHTGLLCRLEPYVTLGGQPPIIAVLAGLIPRRNIFRPAGFIS